MGQGDEKKKAENRSPGNEGGGAKKSVIKAADQASVIRPLASSQFQLGRAGDKARMIDCALIMEGPESLAEWSGFHPEWNKQPQKAFETDRDTVKA